MLSWRVGKSFERKRVAASLRLTRSWSTYSKVFLPPRHLINVELAATKASVVCEMRQTGNDEAGHRAEFSATSAINWCWLNERSILPVRT